MSRLRVLPVLLSIAVLASVVLRGQTDGALTPSELAAAIDSGVKSEPHPYPLRRYPDGRPTEVVGGYAYTPYIRAAMAARDLFQKSKTAPKPADVQAVVSDAFVYVALLDFAGPVGVMRDKAPEPAVQMVLARTVQGDPHRQPEVVLGAMPSGTPAAWVREVASPAPDRVLEVFLDRGTKVLAAFRRRDLTEGGYLIAETRRTDGAGQVRHAVYWVALPKGEAATWR
jgi:hypothetical protein